LRIAARKVFIGAVYIEVELRVMAPTDVLYCGTRLGWDRDERVLVVRGDDVHDLRQRGHANRFLWGYGGGGPIALALSMLCDYLGTPDDSPDVRRMERGLAMKFADAKLTTAQHCWIINGAEIAAFLSANPLPANDPTS
jgi:hypothetical protein